MIDLLLQPMLARGPNNYDVIAELDRRAHRAVRCFTGREAMDVVAGSRVLSRARGRPPCRRLPGPGLREHDPRVAPRRAKRAHKGRRTSTWTFVGLRCARCPLVGCSNTRAL
jgi:hypothetical protein